LAAQQILAVVQLRKAHVFRVPNPLFAEVPYSITLPIGVAS
jgi:hypothetical protein